MRTRTNIEESTRSIDQGTSRRNSLPSRIERLLREMATVVPIEPFLWKESLRILLTHSRPPTVLQELHKNMRAAILRSKYDATFVDRILAALTAADRANGLAELLAPIRLALISFIGGISRRPSVSMSMVGKLIGGTDVAAPLYLSFSTFDRKCRALPIGKVEAMANITVGVQQAVSVLLDERSLGATAFATWNCDECLAGLEALWLAYTYCEVGTANSDRLGSEALRQDLTRFGEPLWRQLDAAIGESASKNVKSTRSDRAAAIGRLLLSVETSGQAVRLESAKAIDPSVSLTHVVCRCAIPESSDKQDSQEIARHRVLEQPLSVVEMPKVESLNASRTRLLSEFPWASAAIDQVFGDLLGRANLGVRDLTLPATLLIGLPGAGKSRLARRIAEEFGLPHLDVSLSGNSDTKLLGGTSRGWGSGRPSDLASLMARRESASAIVMLDEIDKAVDGHRAGGGIAAYLLPLLEPETACRHYDSFLKTECDFSKVSWLCTANTLSGISKPMQSRLRIILIPQPRLEDLPVVCAGVVAELEQRWQLPSGTIPSLTELQLDLTRIASARQARAATEAAVSSWARSVVRH